MGASVSDLDSDYALIDFGDGRRLEQFGSMLIDRPAPAVAAARKANPEHWKTATARFNRVGVDSGEWKSDVKHDAQWQARLAGIDFQLEMTSTGQVGLFPEHQFAWKIIERTVLRTPSPVRMLNLFGYTGGATLVAARAGAEVTHIDAANSALRWGKQNAALNGLQEKPIRWICDGAHEFVKREFRRKKQYEVIVLDPPSYGHSPDGRQWKLDRDFAKLVADCCQILSPARRLLLVSCHTPGWEAAELQSMVSEILLGSCSTSVRADAMTLRDAKQRPFPCGHYAYWQAS
jgi:23S rRNA (cytosine1962-C5)-methyltransferase